MSERDGKISKGHLERDDGFEFDQIEEDTRPYSAEEAAGLLVDSFGRRIKNVRISVTDKCNFRCVYCMPAEGLEWLKRDQILSFEEIERLCQILVSMGVQQVRLTGGEPLVRRDLPVLVSRLHQIEGLKGLSITTNGLLLKELAKPLAEAGLTRINVSLDSLVREKFHELTRRDALHKVLEGLEELEKYPQISPIKINAVAMKGFTESEAAAFGHLARRKPYVVRFIEFMPLDADEIWNRENLLTGDEVKAIIEREVMPLEEVPRADPSDTATRYRFVDGVGELGFINPVSHPFCAACDRIRITAEGALRTCLFAHIETDLKTVLRSGASDEVVEETIRRAVWKKEMKHHINDGAAFKRTKKTMSQIGG